MLFKFRTSTLHLDDEIDRREGTILGLFEIRDVLKKIMI